MLAKFFNTLSRLAASIIQRLTGANPQPQPTSSTSTQTQGFNPNFLGVSMPMPTLSAQLLPLASFAPDQKGVARYALTYPHFSVVMNKQRRLALFTAVNIDGAHGVEIVRENDKWNFDERIPLDWQIGNELYDKNPLDRGHLVRRRDPDWGTLDEATKANFATFHFTNCAPQHEEFNRTKPLWAGLEDYLLLNAQAQAMKICVFTGPIFRTDDPKVAGHGVPREYWKVVAWLKADGTLASAAYRLDQTELLKSMGQKDFTFGKFRTFQTSVTAIQRDTYLTFGTLADVDVWRSQKSLGPDSRELHKMEDMLLR